jgi:hypothetical protein
MHSPLTLKSTLRLELGKASGAAAVTRRPLKGMVPMRLVSRSLMPDRCSGCRLLVFCLLAALAASGCGHAEKSHNASVSKPPTVRIIQPETRKIVRVVGQPSFIESYERTSVYPKLTAYIDKWIVDIGDGSSGDKC